MFSEPSFLLILPLAGLLVGILVNCSDHLKEMRAIADAHLCSVDFIEDYKMKLAKRRRLVITTESWLCYYPELGIGIEIPIAKITQQFRNCLHYSAASSMPFFRVWNLSGNRFEGTNICIQAKQRGKEPSLDSLASILQLLQSAENLCSKRVWDETAIYASMWFTLRHGILKTVGMGNTPFSAVIAETVAEFGGVYDPIAATIIISGCPASYTWRITEADSGGYLVDVRIRNRVNFVRVSDHPVNYDLFALCEMLSYAPRAMVGDYGDCNFDIDQYILSMPDIVRNIARRDARIRGTLATNGLLVEEI